MAFPLWSMATKRFGSRPLLATAVASMSMLMSAPALAQGASCDRACLSGIVDQVLASMPKHDPHSLPLGATYTATENSHPAALGMMTAWRTLSATGKPALLAIDVPRGSAYFALSAAEGGNETALWGRLKVVDRKITELEIYLNRSRGDHGFTFGADEMRTNYAKLMALPLSRKKSTRAELEKLARASFDASDPYTVAIADGCQFTEMGGLVIDPGLDDVPPSAGGPDPEAALGCVFPPFRPTDKKARTIVVDEETGLVVTAGVVPGVVYPYPFRGNMISAFIPVAMKEPSVAQEDWIKRKQKAGKTGLLAPTPATAEAMEVWQLLDGKIQSSQINVYLSGPGMQSVWVK